MSAAACSRCDGSRTIACGHPLLQVARSHGVAAVGPVDEVDLTSHPLEDDARDERAVCDVQAVR